jgi:hypothetical protein
MFKPAAIVIAALLAATAAYAQTDEAWPTFDPQRASTVTRAEVRAQLRAEREAGVQPEGEAFDGEEGPEAASSALRYQVVGDARNARTTGAWPVRDYGETPAGTIPRSGTRKASARRPRKEYPNVMGISFQEWLASHP